MNIHNLTCPSCHAALVRSRGGNMLELPLTCSDCGQVFQPHFYCPDVQASAHHAFAAPALYVDNSGEIYAFCPEHTFTTYALVTASKRRFSPFYPLQLLTQFLSTLMFRLALFTEGLWRQALSRR